MNFNLEDALEGGLEDTKENRRTISSYARADSAGIINDVFDKLKIRHPSLRTIFDIYEEFWTDPLGNYKLQAGQFSMHKTVFARMKCSLAEMPVDGTQEKAKDLLIKAIDKSEKIFVQLEHNGLQYEQYLKNLIKTLKDMAKEYGQPSVDALVSSQEIRDEVQRRIIPSKNDAEQYWLAQLDKTLMLLDMGRTIVLYTKLSGLNAGKNSDAEKELPTKGAEIEFVQEMKRYFHKELDRIYGS
jgi:hypothetical protein